MCYDAKTVVKKTLFSTITITRDSNDVVKFSVPVVIVDEDGNKHEQNHTITTEEFPEEDDLARTLAKQLHRIIDKNIVQENRWSDSKYDVSVLKAKLATVEKKPMHSYWKGFIDHMRQQSKRFEKKKDPRYGC